MGLGGRGRLVGFVNNILIFIINFPPITVYF